MPWHGQRLHTDNLHLFRLCQRLQTIAYRRLTALLSQLLSVLDKFFPVLRRSRWLFFVLRLLILRGRLLLFHLQPGFPPAHRQGGILFLPSMAQAEVHPFLCALRDIVVGGEATNHEESALLVDCHFLDLDLCKFLVLRTAPFQQVALPIQSAEICPLFIDDLDLLQFISGLRLLSVSLDAHHVAHDRLPRSYFLFRAPLRLHRQRATTQQRQQHGAGQHGRNDPL